MSRIYVALDLETTGTAPDRDAIIEIGAVKFRLPAPLGEEPIVARWSTLVNPGRSIPYRISRLTGISDQDVLAAPRLPSVLDELRHFVGNYPVVGHNVAFELAFLQRHGLLVGQASVDTFELASILLPGAPRYSLGELAAYLKLPFEDWHRALADAEMAAQLLLALWDEAAALPPATLDAIVAVAMQSRWPLRSFFAAARQGPSTAPLAPATPRRSSPAPTPGAPPLQPVGQGAALNVAALRGLLEEEGRVAQALPTFEPRAEQQAMVEAVAHAMEGAQHLIVEAGTGVGKTLAYLVAASAFAASRGERVVISTHTLNLQDQIYHDELPRLAQALAEPPTAVRLKGRSNYLCPRRLSALRERGSFSESEARLLARVLVWLGRTESGDREELTILRDEEAIWPQLAADGGSCAPSRCEAHGSCFWQRARQQAEAAHLLVVNHALLLNDLASGAGLLPAYRYLIVDEAHHLEEQATQQFGYTLPDEQLFTTLDRLHHERGGRAAGLLARLRQAARDEPRHDLSRLAERCGYLQRDVAQCRHSAAALFSSLGDLAANNLNGESRHRIRPAWRQWSEWRNLERALASYGQEVTLLAEALGRIGEELYALAQDEAGWLELSDELRRSTHALTSEAEEARRILMVSNSNDICWLRGERSTDDDEEEGTSGRFTLFRAPQEVAGLLHESLFSEKRSVVLTSATLGMEGSFAFVRERLGIAEAEEVALGSPYDFPQQALLYLATDLPEPNQPHYAQALHRALIQLARATQGRLLVLCTSKSQMSAAYHAISEPLAQDDIVVLGQYMDGSRGHLIERFRRMERAVLIGTLSFWEGVDIPGPALSCVAITRLPFPVPTDPVQAARADQYPNGFLDYSLPQAVIRFRQGFGRLLRSSSDRGVVALLDSRLETKGYGSAFLNSLPMTTFESGPVRDLPPRATRWLTESAARGPYGGY